MHLLCRGEVDRAIIEARGGVAVVINLTIIDEQPHAQHTVGSQIVGAGGRQISPTTRVRNDVVRRVSHHLNRHAVGTLVANQDVGHLDRPPGDKVNELATLHHRIAGAGGLCWQFEGCDGRRQQP